jgi:hypothetical protein
VSVPGVVRRAIERLTNEPHVGEVVESSAVPEVDRELVNQVLIATDAVYRNRLDHEYRVIVHRLAVTAATHDQHPLRRRTSSTRLAAALAWIALKGNVEIGRRSRWVAEDIRCSFGVSSCLGLVRKIATSLDMAPTADSFGSTRFPPVGMTLGDVGLLPSRTRAR